jgi:hypothetical protein
MNFLHHYKRYFYRELNTITSKARIGGFYRIYNYKYIDDSFVKPYSSNQTPLILVVGKDTKKKLLHCVKLNSLPLRRFIRLLGEIQNPEFTKKLLTEIEDSQKTMSTNVRYAVNRRAIIIDKTGRAFYKNTFQKKRDLQIFDTYRTYSIPNIKVIKELYFDVTLMIKQLGLDDDSQKQIL